MTLLCEHQPTEGAGSASFNANSPTEHIQHASSVTEFYWKWRVIIIGRHSRATQSGRHRLKSCLDAETGVPFTSSNRGPDSTVIDNPAEGHLYK